MASSSPSSEWQWSTTYNRYYRAITDASGQTTYEWGPETSVDLSPLQPARRDSGNLTFSAPDSSVSQPGYGSSYSSYQSGYHIGYQQSQSGYIQPSSNYSSDNSQLRGGYRQTQGGYQQQQASYQQPQGSYYQSQPYQPQSGYQSAYSTAVPSLSAYSSSTQGYSQSQPPGNQSSTQGTSQSPSLTLYGSSQAGVASTLQADYRPALGGYTLHPSGPNAPRPESEALRDNDEGKGIGGCGPADPRALNYASSTSAAMPPDPVDSIVRASQPNFIPGTPQKGWYEILDSRYRMRTGPETHHFFRVGRVFSMLYNETASESPEKSGPEDDAFTVVKYGEHTYSQLRRFLVVEVKRGFVHAVPISTYNRRGTTKQGCIPSEHAIIYFPGTNPESVYLPGESRMEKDPIRIIPTDSSETMARESRVRFGKTFSIEMNVKVKDIGRVAPEDLSKLVSYWREYL